MTLSNLYELSVVVPSLWEKTNSFQQSESKATIEADRPTVKHDDPTSFIEVERLKCDDMI